MKSFQARAYSAVTALTAVMMPAVASAQTTRPSPFAAGQQGDTLTRGIAGRAGLAQGTQEPTVIVGNIINIALGFLGVLLLIYFLYAGFLWMTSGGDSGQADKAKSYIKNAVIGLVIIVASFALSSFVLGQLARVTANN